jgi:hypothetical protein
MRGFVDTNGRVIPPDWEDTSYFSGGRAAVRRNGKWGFIDKTGNIVIDLEWDRAGPFSEGLAPVAKDGWCGFIDLAGKLVVPLEWKQVSFFSGGMAAVSRNRKSGFINSTGTVTVPVEWDLLDVRELVGELPCGDGDFARAWWALERADRMVDFARGRRHDPQFHNGSAPIKMRGSRGFFDRTGVTYVTDPCGALLTTNDRVDVPPNNESSLYFPFGLAAVRKGNKWGFVEQRGKTIIPLVWDDVDAFSEDLAGVSKDGHWGFVDASGKVAIDVDLDNVKPFSNGLAPAKKGGKWGYVDKDGKTAIEFSYDQSSMFYDGLACIRQDGKSDLVDVTGTSVLPEELRGHFTSAIWDNNNIYTMVDLPPEGNEHRLVVVAVKR